MLNKFLVALVVLGSITAAMAIVALAGCDQPTMALQADPTPPEARLKLVEAPVVCLDGWEAFALPGGSVLYRHEHDVQEHLISCRGDSNG